MKKLVLIVVVQTLFIFTSTAQLQRPGQQRKNIKNTKVIFDIDKYKNQCHQEGDTTWLPRTMKVFYWNGDSLEQDVTYNLLTYNNPLELAELIALNTFNNDTVFKINYDFDENSRKTEELYQTYNASMNTWKNDYKALISYDDFNNIDTTLIQAWDVKQNTWLDSIAEISHWFDSSEVSMYAIKTINEGVWNGIYGYKNVFNFNEDGYVFEDYQYLLNPQTQDWENYAFGNYALNDDGTWNEFIGYSWNIYEQEWENWLKYTVGEWIVYDRFPFSWYNYASDVKQYWWFGNEWFGNTHWFFSFINQELNNFTKKAYTCNAPGEPWYLSDSALQMNYPDKRKQRYWHLWRFGPEEDMRIHFDDSIRWYFYKGALRELYRVTVDTATNQWRPAARVVYSDFVPFVDISDIEEIQNDTGNLHLIPNPADDSFEIKNNQPITEITLFDMGGKMIRREEDLLHAPTIRIDVTKLPPGTYVVKAKTTHSTWLSNKLVVK